VKVLYDPTDLFKRNHHISPPTCAEGVQEEENHHRTHRCRYSGLGEGTSLRRRLA
jgi:hypothetical protein